MARRNIVALAASILFLAGSAPAATLGPGDVLVTDTGVLLRLDPVTGDRTVVSSASVGSGPVFSSRPSGLVVEDDGHLLVSDFDVRAILRIDPATGDRTVVASSTVGSGGTFRPVHIALEFDGDILTIDGTIGNPNTILRVDPTTGDRTVVSSPSVGSGPALGSLRALFRGPGPFVFAAGNDSQHRLFRVDLASGDRTIVSSLIVGSGPIFDIPEDVARDADGSLLVADRGAAAVFRVDATTGDRTVVTSNSVGSGTALVRPVEVWPAPDGSLLLLDDVLPGVIRVDPSTGDRTVFSGPAVGSGPAFTAPKAIALTPTPRTLFGFESDPPGLPPAGLPTAGAVTVEDATFFSPALVAPEGSQVLYLTTGPGANGAGPSIQDLTGDGNVESDRANLFFGFDRGMNDPRHLSLAYDVLTGEISGGIPDPITIGVDTFGPVFQFTRSVGVNNGTYTAITGFGGGAHSGPDGSSFGDGRLGFATFTLPVDIGPHLVIIDVADEFDDLGDTSLVVDHIRLLPEPGALAALASGIALLGSLWLARVRRHAA